jgi:hypothetical protein
MQLDRVARTDQTPTDPAFSASAGRRGRTLGARPVPREGTPTGTEDPPDQDPGPPPPLVAPDPPKPLPFSLRVLAFLTRHFGFPARARRARAR